MKLTVKDFIMQILRTLPKAAKLLTLFAQKKQES